MCQQCACGAVLTGLLQDASSLLASWPWLCWGGGGGPTRSFYMIYSFCYSKIAGGRKKKIPSQGVLRRFMARCQLLSWIASHCCLGSTGFFHLFAGWVWRSTFFLSFMSSCYLLSLRVACGLFVSEMLCTLWDLCETLACSQRGASGRPQERGAQGGRAPSGAAAVWQGALSAAEMWLCFCSLWPGSTAHIRTCWQAPEGKEDRPQFPPVG